MIMLTLMKRRLQYLPTLTYIEGWFNACLNHIIDVAQVVLRGILPGNTGICIKEVLIVDLSLGLLKPQLELKTNLLVNLSESAPDLIANNMVNLIENFQGIFFYLRVAY